MSKRDKLVERFLRRPAEVSFNDVERLMRHFEAQLRARRGSHTVWKHADGRMLTIPLKGGKRVTQPYINEIIDFLCLEEYDI